MSIHDVSSRLRHCAGPGSRRHFLQAGLAGFTSLSLPGMLRLRAEPPTAVTPSSTAVLVDSLKKLGTKKGIAPFVAACAGAEDTADAAYYREVAGLLAQRVAAQGPLARLEFFHVLPVAVSQRNEMVVPLPADLLWWTPTVDEISAALLESKGAPFAGVELWTDAKLTQAAETALRDRGYTISAQD